MLGDENSTTILFSTAIRCIEPSRHVLTIQRRTINDTRQKYAGKRAGREEYAKINSIVEWMAKKGEAGN